jgi:hypothetical protein
MHLVRVAQDGVGRKTRFERAQHNEVAFSDELCAINVATALWAVIELTFAKAKRYKCRVGNDFYKTGTNGHFLVVPRKA